MELLSNWVFELLRSCGGLAIFGYIHSVCKLHSDNYFVHVSKSVYFTLPLLNALAWHHMQNAIAVETPLGTFGAVEGASVLPGNQRMSLAHCDLFAGIAQSSSIWIHNVLMEVSKAFSA